MKSRSSWLCEFVRFANTPSCELYDHVFPFWLRCFLLLRSFTLGICSAKVAFIELPKWTSLILECISSRRASTAHSSWEMICQWVPFNLSIWHGPFFARAGVLRHLDILVLGFLTLHPPCVVIANSPSNLALVLR